MAITTEASTTTTLNRSIALILSADQKKPLTVDQLTPAKRINEQEGYAVLIHQSLHNSDPKLAARFEQELKQATEQFKKNHGEVNLFKITDRLMRQYVRERLLTQESYRQTRDLAFGRTQLDSNRTLLGSERSPEAKGGDTPVRALSTFYRKVETNQPATPQEIAQFRASEALISVEKWREKKKGGVTKAAATGIDASPTASSLDVTPKGFLWKPQSDSDGKLVVLLPTSMNATSVSSLSIKDPKGEQTLEFGRFAGIGNGARMHFRFSKSGANFPDHAIVEIRYVDGSTARIIINDTAQRIEKS